MKRPPKSIDWKALEVEWMQTSDTESMCNFAKRHGLSQTYFYEKVAQLQWNEKKERIRERAIEKATDRAVDQMASRWRVQLNLWKALEMQMNALIAKTMNPERTQIVSPLDAGQLAALSVMLSCSLKSQKLIFGEAGEIKEERNLHAYIAKIVDQIEKENGDAIGLEFIPARDGKRI